MLGKGIKTGIIRIIKIAFAKNKIAKAIFYFVLTSSIKLRKNKVLKISFK